MNSREEDEKAATGGRLGMCANLWRDSGVDDSPSPCPLPQGKRVFDTPSLDGRGKGEGDNHLKSQTPLS